MDDREKKPTTADGVIDELRNVISNLQITSNRDEISEPVLEEVPPENSESVPEPTPPPPTPAANNPPSDHDFWSGNVLGWPSGPVPESAEMPPPPPARPMMTESPAPDFENPESIPLSDRAFLSDDVPPLPPEPAPSPAFSEQPPPAFSQQPPPAVADFSSPIPIPGNRELDDEPASPPKSPSESPEPRLDLESPEIKPSGLIQIACIYPEGEEKQGQQFVNKLRELGEKAKTTLNIQAVFVSGWNTGAVDVSAWTKSAKLSGADAMFVLSRKKDLELFKSIMVNPVKDEIKIRFVTLEYVGLRTLYPDIIIELQRGR